MTKKAEKDGSKAEEATAKTRVYLANWHIKCAHRTIQPGEEMDLDDETAGRLGAAARLKIDEPAAETDETDEGAGE